MQRDPASIVDIVLAGREIVQFTQGLDLAQFRDNSLVRSAVNFQLQIIGEATKRLSKKFRESHPTIPWKMMAGMRDRLIHGYDDINRWCENPFSHDHLRESIPAKGSQACRKGFLPRWVRDGNLAPADPCHAPPQNRWWAHVHSTARDSVRLPQVRAVRRGPGCFFRSR
ncbi:MAG: DUF86 domain-containing protein [Planctomycetota bacterium]